LEKLLIPLKKSLHHPGSLIWLRVWRGQVPRKMKMRAKNNQKMSRFIKKIHKKLLC